MVGKAEARWAPAAAIAATLVWGVSAASAQTVVQDVPFRASDGVLLHATVSGQAPLRLIVEYSPYGQAPGGPPLATRSTTSSSTPAAPGAATAPGI